MTISKYALLLLTSVVFSQSKFTLKGHFNAVANKPITLNRYDLDEPILLDKNITDSNGNFTMTYPADYMGAAILEVDKKTKLIVLLNHENFEIQWDDLSAYKTLKFINSKENSAFDAGLKLYQNTESKRKGINYLLPFYNDEAQKQQFFLKEKNELDAKMNTFLNDLPTDSYAKFYLKIRVLISDFSLSANLTNGRLPILEQEFVNLNFTDERLLHSGLYFELIDQYVIAMESYGDKRYSHLNSGIDQILKNLSSQPNLKQNVAEYWFNLLEKRSLFEASEHLALAMLSDTSCNLDDKHKALFEQYRKMANGNTAPNIKFENSKQSAAQLSDLKSNYKLIVFGASWCPKCTEEIPKLKAFYEDWKSKYKLEVIFISLDTQKSEYLNFIKDFPWISSCDFKSWEGNATKDYCVFGTPTMYLLDAENKIKVKPTSPEQINSWLAIH